MVLNAEIEDVEIGELSVLALSSRFDGRMISSRAWHCVYTFSTRSVESF